MNSGFRFSSMVLSCLLWMVGVSAQVPDYGKDYTEAWKSFYPDRALSLGIHSSVFDFEDYSEPSVRQWLGYNKAMLEQLEESTNWYVTDQAVDSRLLINQIRKEIARWEYEQPHRTSYSFYTRLIRDALDKTTAYDFLNNDEKASLLCRRIRWIPLFCADALRQVETAERADLEQAIRHLEKSLVQLERMEDPAVLSGSSQCKSMDYWTKQSIESIANWTGRMKDLLPVAVAGQSILGREEYTRKLERYTDSIISPDSLAEKALQDIHATRALMQELADSYLIDKYGKDQLPEDEEKRIRLALGDMESDAPTDALDYLNFWRKLAADAVDFIQDHQLVSLPDFETLQIVTAPESAGAAARIGWVDSAPPFDPNPTTTLYLPSIPDTLSPEAQRDFWASFNKPFNRMIVIHELYPGHYLQMKMSRKTPHPLRLYFPYQPYIEGWATFVERVFLDQGWDQERPLTFLAHLRKRLENANRAYTSVQVHCNGWTEEEVMNFSINTSLLAPQFAKSLWGRLLRSPMQMTSYFYGGHQFDQLLYHEKKRLGERFNLRNFLDTILRAGPITIYDFKEIFHTSYPD